MINAMMEGGGRWFIQLKIQNFKIQEWMRRL